MKFAILTCLLSLGCVPKIPTIAGTSATWDKPAINPVITIDAPPPTEAEEPTDPDPVVKPDTPNPPDIEPGLPSGGKLWVTLSWDPVTTNVDGTPIDDLAGYRLYVLSDVEKIYQTTADKQLIKLHLAPGDYTFTVTAFNTSDYESARSVALVRRIE